MAMDNPSYFAVPQNEHLYIEPNSNPFRHKDLNMGGNKFGESFSSPHHVNGTRANGTLSIPRTLSLGEPSSLHFSPSPDKHQRHEFAQSPMKSPSSSAYLVPNGGIPSPRSENKRSFRSLLRSLSANAASSPDAQSILLGEPRPSDIAPPNHSDPFSVRSNRRLTHSRNISLRSCAEIRAVEFQHSVMKRRAQEFGANEDIFHTMPLPGTGRRRHSIGAYLSRERKASAKNVLKVTSVPSEVPRVEAPRVGSPGGAPVRGPPAGPRAPVTTTLHCQEPPQPLPEPPLPNPTTHKRRKQRSQSIKDMESIVVVWCRESPEAGLWANYFTSCFDKIIAQRARQHYKVFAVHIEDMSQTAEESPKVKQVANAKLQLLIMCPRMLSHVEELPENLLDVLNVFQAEKVLTMLLGVNDDMVSDIHRKAFPSYDEWQRMIVKEQQDNTFVDNVLTKAVDIMSRKYRPAVDKASFSIIPKKIKPGQNRVIALLNEPISNEDVITVQVDKKGEILQIHSFKKRNPYTLQFDVPDCCLEVSMLVWIKIEKNGVSCGSRQIKCESRLRELDQILRGSDNPLEFMCQTLGFKTTDKDQLDSWMLTAFQRNIPPHFNLLSTPLQGNLKVNTNSVDEYPTLLHFAARFGLERLCWQLLECPGGEAACAARNLRHLTPADLAHHHGFPQLATVLRGYMQMNEFSNMYYYLKNMSEDGPDGVKAPENIAKILNTDHTQESWAKFSASKSTITPINTPDTNRSDPFSEECLQNLEAKPSNHKFIKAPESPRVPTSPKLLTGEWLYENDMCQMNSSFISQKSIQKAIEHDYLIQPSNIKVEIVETPPPNRPKLIELNMNKKNNSQHSININSPVTEKPSPFQLPPEFFESKCYNNIPQTKNKHSASVSVSSKSSHDHATTPTGQDELAEIINDFKNNVFSISEVEKLVLDWRNRNETQQSLKEKQEQLNKMREEYDKLQRRIKDDMKRPTPFDRVRKIFSKGKSKNGKTGMTDSKLTGQRPNSGLSIHSVSSSSSGRLSTASGGSLGDSGTQSDNDDAKMFMEMHAIPKSPSKLSSDRFVLEDYLIPPPPRPFSNPPPNPSHPVQHHNPRKNDPLPNIPICHSKQEYILKSPYPMDTISERDVPLQVQETSLDQAQCSQDISPLRYLSNDVSEHQYMNMSPA